MLFCSCLLCGGGVHFFVQTRSRNYYRCDVCGSAMLDPAQRLEPEKELQRYQLHVNNPSDDGYRKFLQPLTTAVSKLFSTQHHGLDYGSGPTPTVTLLLRDKGYDVTPFDPFFSNDPNVVKQPYDFIVCSETAEHFYYPFSEFQLLRSLLKPEGRLFLLTALYDESVDFETWHYKNDPTHVFFYTTKAFQFIRDQFKFSSLAVNGRLIELSV